MEQETAGSGVTPAPAPGEAAELTTGETSEVTTEESDCDQVPGVNMRLKAVTRALISATVDEDEELRLRSSDSLARLGQAHPLTVMAEWLSVFTSARHHGWIL